MSNSFSKLFDFSMGARRFLISEALIGFGIGIFSLVLNLHLLELGYNEKEIGEVLSFGPILMCIVCIPILIFANRFDRKKLFVLGSGLIGLSYFVFGFGTQIWHFLIAQTILICGNTILVTFEMPLLYDYCRNQKDEVKAFNFLYAMFTFCMSIGILIGGYIPKWIKTSGSSYQFAIFVSGGILILLTIIRAYWLPNVPKLQKEIKFIEQPQPTNAKSRIKNFALLIFFILLVNFVAGWVGSFVNVILKVKLSWPDESVSSALAIYSLFMFGGSMLVPLLLEKMSVFKCYLLVIVLSIISNFVLVFALPSLLFISFIMVRGGLGQMLTNMVESQAISIVANNDRNLFSGIRSIVKNIGIAFSTFLTGILLVKKDYSMPFVYTIISLLFCLLFFIVYIRPIFSTTSNK